MKRQQKDIEANKKAQDIQLGLKVQLVKQKTANNDDAIRGQITEDIDTYCKEISEAREEVRKIQTGLGDVGNLAKALRALLKSVKKSETEN